MCEHHLCTGSTKLTPVPRAGSSALHLGASAGGIHLLRAASDGASPASDSDTSGGVGGLRRRRSSGGSGGSSSVATGSPPRTSLSTQDLMRGAYSPPDDSPVDLSEVRRRNGCNGNESSCVRCVVKSE